MYLHVYKIHIYCIYPQSWFLHAIQRVTIIEDGGLHVGSSYEGCKLCTCCKLPEGTLQLNILSFQKGGSGGEGERKN